MKKIHVLLFVFLCIVSVAYAAGILIVNDVHPTLEATFNETVILDSANLTFVASGEQFSMDNSSSDNRTFRFTPLKPLQSGFYSFIVIAQDKIGNAKNYTKDIIVDVPETVIRFIKPLHGISKTPDFDIVIGTSRVADCKYSLGISGLNYSTMINSFPSSTGTSHSILNYHYVGLDESTVDFYVGCKDIYNFTVQSSLEIGYDSTPPVITTSLSENPVTTYPPREVITVTADDEVVCYSNGVAFTGQDRLKRDTYSYHPQNIIEYPSTVASNGDYQYIITCENLAESTSAPATVPVTVALEDRLSINVISPTRFIKDQLIYKVATNKPAQCTASLDAAPGITLTPDNESKIHTLVDGTPLPGKDHIITYICTTKFANPPETARSDFVFQVDNTPPSTPIVNASACSSDTLFASFSAFDNQSGIKGYNYSVTGSNVTVNGTFTSSPSVEIKNLRLVLGQTYVVKAFSINNAGSSSASQGQSPPLIFNPNATVECKEKNPPVLIFNVSLASNGKKVTVLCSDESGCNQNSFFYGLSITSSCNATHPGKEVIIQSNQYVCAQAADTIGNTAYAKQYISVANLSPSCTNNIKDSSETDIDCGGPCSPCALGKQCTVNLDCADRSCGNNICIAPSCSNNKSDGFEPDIDCGGTCSIKCSSGKSCVSDSDCSSNSCDFGTCTAAKAPTLTWEQWAQQHGIDPVKDRNKVDPATGLTYYQEYLKEIGQYVPWEQWAPQYGISQDDKNGDADHDGVSNYDEYLNGTDPTNAYDTPGVGTSRFLPLGVGILILVLGLLFLYYFHADKQTSFNMMFIGGGLLAILLVHWFIIYIPKYVMIALSLIALGSGGYFVYTQKDAVIPKLTGKKPTFTNRSPQNPQPGVQQSKTGSPQISKPLSREELAATKEMIEMIKREKLEREKRKTAVFGKFSGTSSEKNDTLPMGQIRRKTQTTEKSTPTEKTSQVKQSEQQKQTPQKEDSAFDRLSRVVAGKNNTLDKLDSLSGKGTKKDTFDRLSSVSKSRQDIFSKLPTSSKNIDDLARKEKDKKRRK